MPTASAIQRNAPRNARVIPDPLVRKRGAPGGSLAIDAKYKLYDERSIDSGDIYQTFLYAYALAQDDDGRTPTALLIYPPSGGEQRAVRLEVRPRCATGGANIFGLGVTAYAWLDFLRRPA